MPSVRRDDAPRLRLATADDAAAIVEIYAPSITGSIISFETEVPSIAEMQRRIAATLERTAWLVCEHGGSILGYAYASKHHERAAYQWCIDASVYVSAAARRRGVARALYGALFALSRLQGFCAVHAGVSLPNVPSVSLHEALGFVPIGVHPAVGYKLGGWHAVGWWQLELAARDRPPAPVTPLPALLAAQPEVLERLAATALEPLVADAATPMRPRGA